MSWDSAKKKRPGKIRMVGDRCYDIEGAIEKESVPSVFCTGTDRKKNWRKRELTGLQRDTGRGCQNDFKWHASVRNLPVIDKANEKDSQNNFSKVFSLTADRL